MNAIAEKTPKIEIDNLSKVYQGRSGPVTALQNTQLAIGQNEFVCVVGPSGCGKTTLLNIIAGLENATTGTVKVENRIVTGPGKERESSSSSTPCFPGKPC